MPTRDRAATLGENLGRLARDRDGPGRGRRRRRRVARPDARRARRRRRDPAARAARRDRETAGGPGAARNSGLEVADAPVHLFLGDDTRATAGLIARHLDFHRLNCDRGRAARADRAGRLDRAPPSPTGCTRAVSSSPSPRIEPEPGPADVVQCRQRLAQARAARARRRFRRALRVRQRRRRAAVAARARRTAAAYDPDAVAEHEHPTDLRSDPARECGASGAPTACSPSCTPAAPAAAAGRPAPAQAAALTAAALRARPRLVREAPGTFLCEEAHREAFWGEPDPPDVAPVRIGAAGSATRRARSRGAVIGPGGGRAGS